MKKFKDLSFALVFAVSAFTLAGVAQAASSFELGTETPASGSVEPSENFVAEARAVVRLSRLDAAGKPAGDADVVVESGSSSQGQSPEVAFRPADAQDVASAKTEERFYNFIINAEGGLVFQTNNDIAVPGGSGSRFDLADVAPGPYASFRVYLWWMITQKHSLRLLYAPLSVTTSFTPSEDILFDQVNFLAGRTVDALYKFNSYRLSYIYHFDAVGKFSFRVGFTAKIRDAAIELESGSSAGSTTDIGFVPLLNFGVRYAVSDKFYLDLDADGSWAPQGRAIDAALKAGYQIHPNVALEAGYRVVEGGADVAQVYNFAWFNSVFFGVSARF